MRKNIIAGNWKMNKNLSEAKELIKGIKEGVLLEKINNTRIIVAPSFVNLLSVVKVTEESIIEVAAQNVHELNSGAFTGEVSANMLSEIGVKSVIVGHSERRSIYVESNELLAKKIDGALANKMEVIFCFGESLEDRKLGKQFQVIEEQLKSSLFHLPEEVFASIILAYEPVWAIGTGETATPEQAQEMHLYIRNLLKKNYNEKLSDNISILYGGSVKPSNAKEIFSKPDVDGGLIGGASLNSSDFLKIIESI